MKSLFRALVFPGIALLGGLFLALSANAFAAVAERGGPIATYVVGQSVARPELDANHSRFVLDFDFSGIQGYGLDSARYEVEYSCNGVIDRYVMLIDQVPQIVVSPGKYVFQIYSSGFPEITTDSITIAPGYETTITVTFADRIPVNDEHYIQEKALKPVIYTYSENAQPFSLDLKPSGKFTFTYPSYDNGWKGTAHADGSSTVNGKTYPYLFWEDEQILPAVASDYSSGFVVKQDEVIAFLEDKLTQMGLNAKEQTDFITFWGPRMAQAEQGFVRFMFTDDYDQIAEINISPKPDNLFRVYMFWTPLPNGETLPTPNPQTMEKVNREGFYLIEWGGSEVTFQNS